ncbi:MAG: hypothetical protein LBH17_02905, partial [Oscillospiraceae bacterium]|nr:hypothetical protein [Oscillospiraceae bacterium]
MTEKVMDIDALQAYFVTTFRTKQVRVRESDDIVTVEPVEKRAASSCSRVRGLLADCPDMSVDKFLERKHADKEFDL